MFYRQQGAHQFLEGNMTRLLTLIHNYWGHDLKLVHLLTMLACELKRAISNYPLETVDLSEKLSETERMIERCFLSPSLSKPQNITACLLPDRSHTHYENPITTSAQSFISGPLRSSLDSGITSITVSSQVCRSIGIAVDL